MRISDWSSDVCSSDLRRRRHRLVGRRRRRLVGRWRWRWLDVERVQLLRNLLDVLVRQAGHEGIAERNVEQADNHQRHYATSARIPISVGHSETRSEEHTSELQSLMRNSYAVFC